MRHPQCDRRQLVASSPPDRTSTGLQSRHRRAAIAILPLSTKAEVVERRCQRQGRGRSWGTMPPMKRVRPMFRFKELLEKNADEIARAISAEHGKTHADALGRTAAWHRSRRISPAASPISEGRIQRATSAPRSTAIPTASRSASAPASRRSTSRPWCRCGCSGRHRLRQHLRPEAVRARSLRPVRS